MAHDRSEIADPRLSLPEVDPGTEFELFFEVEFERMFGAAYLATGSRRDADHLAHLALLRTWDRWARVREMEQPSSFPIRVALDPLKMPWRRATVSAHSRLHGERKLEPFEDISIDDRVRQVLEAMSWRRRAALMLTESLHLTPGETGRALRMRARRLREETADASTDLTDGLAADVEPTTPGTVLGEVRLAAAPAAGAFTRHLSLRRRTRDRRRIVTVTCALSLAALVIFLGSRGSTSGEAVDASPTPVQGALDAGTYRLPDLSTAATVTLPEGWRAGDSIWGSDGRGFAAVTTGPDGGSVSVAVFDLAHLNPVDPVGHVYTQTPARLRQWYDGFDTEFEREVRPRLRSSIAGVADRWQPNRPLGWILSQVPRGPIQVSEPIIADRLGTLASFVNTGPSSALFGITGVGTISLRPDVTYTFWVPTDPNAFGTPIMVGIAREAGSIPTTGEWTVVGSLAFDG
jgi:DNA-directed RNA polymerase specialized sigma24 family protein